MSEDRPPITMFGPDFAFAHDAWVAHPAGLGEIPAENHGREVAVIGAGLSGLVVGHELMKLGLKPVIYESGQLGGRLRSQPFEGTTGAIAELGGMRFPISSTGFYHYINRLGLDSHPFPNPLTEAAGSTVIHLEGETHYAESPDDLPEVFQEVARAYDEALEEGFGFAALQSAIRSRDPARVKELWDPLVREWSDRSFYDFVASSSAFSKLSFRHREIFGQVGFGTGGWDSDFPNSVLEILRVNATGCDENQRYIVGGVEQLPRGLWRLPADKPVHWPAGTSLESLHGRATLPGVVKLARKLPDRFEIADQWGRVRAYDAVVVACQTWLLTTAIETDEQLFSDKLWMALDRTRYMQSSKTFVLVDRPFWRDRDPETGREVMSNTLTDRMTRGTYLFENGPDEPAVMCLTYSWMGDAMKVLPLDVNRRVELALSALSRIYPKVDIASHIIADPITVSWENDPNFLGAFKGALPGHYRYNERLYSHFMQARMPPAERGIFLCGDDIGWTPGWAEGAVQTALNVVWGVVNHFGGAAPTDNPGPGERYEEFGPVRLPD